MTFETGEDFHISHTMRKYANIGTYVMPYNAEDDETKGSKYRGLSFISAATSNRREAHTHRDDEKETEGVDARERESYMLWIVCFHFCENWLRFCVVAVCSV